MAHGRKGKRIRHLARWVASQVPQTHPKATTVRVSSRRISCEAPETLLELGGPRKGRIVFSETWPVR